MPNRLPGGDALVKAVLQSLEGANLVLEFEFNPQEITIDKTVPWQQHPSTSGSAVTLVFHEAQPRTLLCDLVFDLVNSHGDVYAAYISTLEHLAHVNPDLERPPLCSFTWGAKFPVFKGVIEQLTTKYTVFLPDGTPARATVGLRMREAAQLLNHDEASA